MTMWPWGLQLGRNTPSETAQAAYKGQLYQRRSDGIYLKDFGRGDSDDSAKLYSGQMLDFDGVDDYVDCGSITKSSQGTICGTILNAPSSIGYFASCWSGANRLYIRGSKYSIYIGVGDLAGYDVGINPNTDNFRYYLTYDDNTLVWHVYICNTDGTLQHATGSYTGQAAATNTFYIGKVDSGTYFEGPIGNVQIWNAAFDADDVTYDYQNCFLGDITAANRPGTSLSPSNLKGWWKLIEGSGSTAYDWSGNGNHGTLVGFPTDDSQWVNAEQLSDPIVIQTALTEWGMGSNDIPYSTEFNRWNKLYTTVTDNAVIAPNEAMAGAKIADTTDHKKHQIVISTQTYPSGTLVEVTICAKANTLGEFTILKGDWGSFTFDVSAGTCTSGAKIIPIGNGWYKCKAKATTTADISEMYLMLKTGVYTGDGSSLYVYNFTMHSGTGLASVETGATGVVNALIPLQSWDPDGQFLRTHGELNWNGRSYADCGNGADVAPTDTVLVETVFAYYSHEGTRGYVTSDSKATCRVYPYYEDPVYLRVKLADGSSAYVGVRDNGSDFVEGKLYHIVLAYSKANQSFYGYVNGVASINNVHNPDTWQDLYSQDVTRRLCCSASGSHIVSFLGQLPLFKMHVNEKAQAIIDGDLDAWAQKQYLKAKAKYDL